MKSSKPSTSLPFEITVPLGMDMGTEKERERERECVKVQWVACKTSQIGEAVTRVFLIATRCMIKNKMHDKLFDSHSQT